MIKLLRIDERLIHGQVVTYWIKYTKSDTIIVLNDKAATDSMLKMSLKLGKPAGVKLEILTLKDGISYINNPSNKKKKMFLIVGNCKDALKVAKNSPEISDINIGGVHYEEGRVPITNQVFLGEEDLNALYEIKAKGKNIFLQSIPNVTKMPLEEIHEMYNRNKNS